MSATDKDTLGSCSDAASDWGCIFAGADTGLQLLLEIPRVTSDLGGDSNGLVAPVAVVAGDVCSDCSFRFATLPSAAQTSSGL